MPIKPENRARYPKDWRSIAASIRERAGNLCEGSPAYPLCRAQNGEPHPETGSRVVLTVAHLDHTPENCEPANLKAMCQRCHLTYDAEHHKRTAYATRKKAAKTADLFAEPFCDHLWMVTHSGVTWHDCQCDKCGATKRDTWD